MSDASLIEKLEECREFSYKAGEPHMLKLINEAIDIARGHQAKPKLHFSNCSIYSENGLEIPNGHCDCGGCVEDKFGTLNVGSAHRLVTRRKEAPELPE